MGRGVIVGAKAFANNPFDGHTLEAAIAQVESMTGKRPERVASDKGYQGRNKSAIRQSICQGVSKRRPQPARCGLPGIVSAAEPE